MMGTIHFATYRPSLDPLRQAWAASQVPLTEHICGVRLRTRACTVHKPDLSNTAVLVLPVDEDPPAMGSTGEGLEACQVADESAQVCIRK